MEKHVVFERARPPPENVEIHSVFDDSLGGGMLIKNQEHQVKKSGNSCISGAEICIWRALERPRFSVFPQGNADAELKDLEAISQNVQKY